MLYGAGKCLLKQWDMLVVMKPQLFTAALSITLALAIGCEAVAKSRRSKDVPQSKLQREYWKGTDDSGESLFSSPDADSRVVPTYVTKGGRPVNVEAPVAEFLRVKSIPSLTKAQLALVDKLQQKTISETLLDREQVMRLQQRLVVVKGHPKSKILIQHQPIPCEVELTIEIAKLKYEIAERLKEAGIQLQEILTAEQRADLVRMRHGEMLVEPASLPDDTQSDKVTSVGPVAKPR